MQKLAILLLALFAVVLPLEAQSNSVIDALLDSREAAFGDAVYLVLSAARIIPEKATPNDAVWTLQAKNLGVAGRSAKEPISLGEYAFLMMKAFDIRGGIMYRIAPGPRYACRELAFLGLLEGFTAPNRRLAGDEALRILGRFLEQRKATP
ncbi:MAG: hypothetical protein A2177_13885 [Spirochaetes bacterium RBG_13_68_11]|nr:MAG: hypothetical protein A2177_13885 [Spirochaetes bacterium RBG_13_68_11]